MKLASSIISRVLYPTCLTLLSWSGVANGSDVSGTWVIAPEPASYGVGPSEFDVSWWSNDTTANDNWACRLDDEYIFNEDGSYAIDHQSETFVEEWQGVESASCGLPVAPHDGSNAATWEYDDEQGTLTLDGVGAYVGLARPVNGAELASPGDAPLSVVYNAYPEGNGVMRVTIEAGDGIWWSFKLYNKSRYRDSDGDGIPDIGDVFPQDATEWLDTDGNGIGNFADAAREGNSPFCSTNYCASTAAGLWHYYQVTEEANEVPIELVYPGLSVDGLGAMSGSVIEVGADRSNYRVLSSDDYDGLRSQVPDLLRNSRGTWHIRERVSPSSLSIFLTDNYGLGIRPIIQLNGFGVGETVDQLGPLFDSVVLVKPEQGCTNVSLKSLDPLLSARSGLQSFPDLAVENGEGDLLLKGENEIALCSSTPEGVYNYNLTVLDGLGGKAFLPLEISVLDEATLGGGAFWGGTAGDIDGDGISNDADSDNDNDGTPDTVDAYPLDPNEWNDADGDGIGDNADADIALTVFVDGNVGSEWDRGINAFDQALNWGECSSSADCPSIAWEMVSDSDRGDVLEITHANNGNLAALFFASTTVVDLTDFANGAIEFDIKVVSGDANITMKLDCNYPCTSGDQLLGEKGVDGWESVSVAMSGLNASGLDLSKVSTGAVIWATKFQDTVFQIDNVRFVTAADNSDTDGDGVSDSSDAFPLDASESVDTDGDGIGNNADADDDGDGVNDSSDAFPLDAAETEDTDGDGVGDNSDPYPNDPYNSEGSGTSGSITPAFAGTFGGLHIAYEWPSGAESWAGVANEDESIYPLVFEGGGSISFLASVPSGNSAEVRFRIERRPFPDVDPAYDTEVITVSGSEPARYTIDIPSQSDNTFESFLFYVLTPDEPVLLSEVAVLDDRRDGRPNLEARPALTGDFGGFSVGYEWPTGAEDWAGVANIDTSIYPLIFENGGQIKFDAGVLSGNSAEVRFRIERLPFPDVDPSYDTPPVAISGATESTYIIDIPPQGANTFESLLFYVMTRDERISLSNVEVLSFGETGPGSSPSGIVGTWLIANEIGSFGVGPSEFDVSWWSNDAGVNDQRACFLDDEYTFSPDGSYSIEHQNDTWIESWQGVENDGCGAPIAPHDNSNAATWEFDEEQGTLTLGGLGAYVGLAKAVNGAEIASSAEAPSSVVYKVYPQTDGAMVLTIEAGAGVWWNYKLYPKGWAGPQDSDGDGVNDPDDAFPYDPSETSDWDGDGIGDNGDTDDDNDGVMDADDRFPLDSSESRDTDGDGIGNNADYDDDNDGLPDDVEISLGTNTESVDTDGDGSPDGVDSFPLDNTEQSDFDGDGIGDIADTDDDNDGILDAQDLFPLHALSQAIIEADLTESNMPFGVVSYIRGAVDDPSVRLGSGWPSWLLSNDGRFRDTSNVEGQWQEFGGGYRLIAELSSETSFPYLDLNNNVPTRNDSGYMNLNYEALNSDPGFIASGSGQIEVRYGGEAHIAVIEKGSDTWRIVLWSQNSEFAVNESLVIDPEKPIRVTTSELVEFDILAPTADFVPFTAAELLGSWTLEHLNRDDVALASHCLDELSQCADIIEFYANNTAMTELSGRSAIWDLTSDGGIEITFVDNGTQISVRRISRGEDTSTVLINFSTDSIFVNDVRMMIKRSAPAPEDISAFFGTFLSNSFTVTTDDPGYSRRSLIDGGFIGNFGFMLNADGTGERASIGEFDRGDGLMQGYVSRRDLTWTSSGSRFESETCFNSQEIDGEQVCLGFQKRAWDLVRVTDTRFYVHETLSFEEDYDQDGEFVLGYSISRPNFYELTPYYDLDDVDRDGYRNDEDAFPTNEFEWLDSDSDGVGDNVDPDADIDNDGIINRDDLDDDNDGLSDEREVELGTNPGSPDTDRDGVSDGQDDLPLDGSEQFDNDGDGIGDIADSDDDNDGILDGDDLFPRSDINAEIIPADLTESNMPFGVVTFARSVVEDPSVRQGSTDPSWLLSSDGQYRRTGTPRFGGQWTQSGDGYRLEGDLREEISYQYINLDNNFIDRNNSGLMNLNREAVEAQFGSSEGQIEVRYKTSIQMAVVGQGPDTWRLVRTWQDQEFAVDESLVLDPTKPIRIYSSELVEFEVVAPTTTFVPFTASEVVGAWAIEHLNRDDVSLAPHCIEAAAQCADIMTFNANGTAITELSNRSATWEISSEGHLEVAFVDNGTQMTLRRMSVGADTSTTLISFINDTQYVNHVEMMIKRSAPAPEDISAFFGTFASSSFFITTDDRTYAQRSLIDGGLINNFGFMLYEDGTGERVSGLSRRPLTWSQAGSRFESETCFSSQEIEGENVCLYFQTRAWDLIKVTDRRFYVHETLSVQEDFDQDGEYVLGYSISRPNFYELTAYYDIDDVDRDGYRNDEDAFPTNELEWFDNDGDGVGDNSDPDADVDNDGIINGEDSDDDNDGLSDDQEVEAGTNPTKSDTDGDSVVDGRDAFPLDQSEQFDNDGDGIGDVADTDDDNDGISDVDDLFPRHVLDNPIIATDLTESEMPMGVVIYSRGAVDDPRLEVGNNYRSWLLSSDGRFRKTPGYTGDWIEFGGGYRLQSDFGEESSFPYIDLNNSQYNDERDSGYINLNSDALKSQWGSSSGQIEVRAQFKDQIAVIEKGPDVWRIAVSWQDLEYAVDESLVINPGQPVRVIQGSLVELDILAPTVNMIPFTAAELLGAWTFDFLNFDDLSLAPHCIEGASQCSDIIKFNADQTAITELSGRSAIWELTPEGYLEIEFVDNGTQMSLHRIAKGGDTSTVLINYDNDEQFVKNIRMMVKRSAPEPTDISSFYGTFLSNSFTVTRDLRYSQRSSIDGGLIGTFGFLLNEDGTGERVYVTDLDAGDGLMLGYVSREALTWTLSGSRFESVTCRRYEYRDDEDVCIYFQTRVWDLIKVTEKRFYVLETLSVTEDFDGDGEFNLAYSVSRPNFYELTPYYDLDDVDRDGYWNGEDAFPTNELEWLDSDGDGVGDNADPDNIVDTDGDGVPDNADAFPSDPNESVDADGDGIGANTDLDDNDSSVGSQPLDSDADGLTNDQELEIGTDPNSADSDGDGLPDGIEVELGTNPLEQDTDNDGYTDGEEHSDGTSPTDDDDMPSAGMSMMLLKAAIDAAAARAP